MADTATKPAPKISKPPVQYGAAPVHAAESKADKFRRLANARVPKCIKVIRHVANLGNRLVYSYTDEQRDKLLTTIEAEVKALRNRFTGQPETTDAGPLF